MRRDAHQTGHSRMWFTPEEAEFLAEARRLAGAGHGITEVSRRLGLGGNGLHPLLMRYGFDWQMFREWPEEDFVPPPPPRLRACIDCGARFKSHGPGDRRCGCRPPPREEPFTADHALHA